MKMLTTLLTVLFISTGFYGIASACDSDGANSGWGDSDKSDQPGGGGTLDSGSGDYPDPREPSRTR